MNLKMSKKNEKVKTNDFVKKTRGSDVKVFTIYLQTFTSSWVDF